MCRFIAQRQNKENNCKKNVATHSSFKSRKLISQPSNLNGYKLSKGIIPYQYILGLDLVSMSLFIIDLPNGLEHSNPEMLQLSQEEDSKLYIFHLNGLKLHIWFHDINNTGNTSNWVLIDTISFLEVFGHIANPSWDSEVDIKIARGGNSGDFIYLHVDDDVYLVHIKKRMVEKVFDNGKVFRVHPFMMAWPPTFTKKIMMGNILK